MRPLDPFDAPELAAAYARNRNHLRPWEPTRPDVFFTAEGQQGAVARCVTDREGGRGYFWVLVEGDAIVGRISLTDVVRGVFQSGNLGYWVAADRQGKGIASAAVARVCGEAAEVLGLHRIQAGTVVHNIGSQRVLERCSFTRIGLAEKYLAIDGRWQDHVLFQRILRD
ncbi:MAG: GNAT family protein [Arachnia sp.]